MYTGSESHPSRKGHHDHQRSATNGLNKGAGRTEVHDFEMEKYGEFSNETNSRVLEINLGNGTSNQKAKNKYRLDRIISSGHFGKIYVGTDRYTGEVVAIKVQHPWRGRTNLRHEYEVYTELQGGIGIPKVLWFGRDGRYDVMVMELLGTSLEDRLVSQSHKFSLKTVLLLAEVLIDRFEYIHSKGYIYRDLKPDNFLSGFGSKENIIYLIDFGLSKRFRDANTLEHIPYLTNKSFVGSLSYASVNAQLGIQQSRRDDMESLGYILVYLLRGTLPWFGLQNDTMKEKYALTLDLKMELSKESICHGCPPEFFIFIKICQSMRFDAEPNYSSLRKLFRNVLDRYNYTSAETFDWEGDSTLKQYNKRIAITSISPLVRRWLDRSNA
ncbi:casein kinase I-like [Pecten maximus]|uniref:casein kinase I-like n=1 Tax=Pecten maximus TaxID=6579 RepID=UPI001459110F|nr:casein kinase I-like [Pecten maximus]